MTHDRHTVALRQPAMILCLHCGAERPSRHGDCPKCKRWTFTVEADSAEAVVAWREAIEKRKALAEEGK